GPIPAGSPSVIPIRRGIGHCLGSSRSVQWSSDYGIAIRESRIVNIQHRTLNIQRRSANARRFTSNLNAKHQTSVHLDVGFLAQTSQPAVLLGLRFFCDQFFLNLVAYFGEGARDAAAFIFDFENIIVPAELDDVADFAGSQVERDFLERRRQGAAIHPRSEEHTSE